MKRSSEVQSLPIISIADGVEIGKVKSLIINPEKRSVDFITIEHEEWEQEGKAIPFNKIIGIGDYALTIEQESNVIEMNSIPVANELLNRKTKIEQTRLMTKKGQLIGEAVEYMIDDETGEIVQLIVKDSEGSFIVNGQFVVTYGRDLIVVSEDVVKESPESEAAVPHSLSIQPEDSLEAVQEKQQPVLKVEEPINAEAGIEELPLLEEIEAEPEPVHNGQEESEASSIDRWLQMIDDQHSKLLAGKTVVKDIEVNGEVLIPAGEVLAEEHIQKARSAGPEVLVELSMNSEA